MKNLEKLLILFYFLIPAQQFIPVFAAKIIK